MSTKLIDMFPTPETWTQHGYAKDHDGYEVGDVIGPQVAGRCLLGGALAAAGFHNEEEAFGAGIAKRLDDIVRRMFDTNARAVDWNDYDATYEQVLQVAAEYDRLYSNSQ
jgi:hypothetical protein